MCALAREAATATHQTQTSVIERALQELLDRHKDEASKAERLERVWEIVQDMQRRWAATDSPDAFTIDDLYDENGLPA